MSYHPHSERLRPEYRAGFILYPRLCPPVIILELKFCEYCGRYFVRRADPYFPARYCKGCDVYLATPPPPTMEILHPLTNPLG